MKIYIIHPINEANPEFSQKVYEYVMKLEERGHQVHLPVRDTPQESETGYEPCLANLQATKNADEVHIAWDGKSRGSLFDMGMAFALGKYIKIIPGLFPAPPGGAGKCFERMVPTWEKKQMEPSESNEELIYGDKLAEDLRAQITTWQVLHLHNTGFSQHNKQKLRNILERFIENHLLEDFEVQ